MSTDILCGTWCPFTGFVNMSSIFVLTFVNLVLNRRDDSLIQSKNSKPVVLQKLPDDKICFRRVSNINDTILVFRIPFLSKRASSYSDAVAFSSTKPGGDSGE